MLRNNASRLYALAVAVLSFVTVLVLPIAAPAYAQPEIMSRAAWKAKPANTGMMKRQVPRSIVIHHTSVRQQPGIPLERKMQALQAFSLKPGKVGVTSKPAWGDVPYHFYIDASGRIAEGRDVNYAGDSNTRYDVQDRVQVVLEGDFEKEQPTLQQLKSLRQLVGWLGAKYNIPGDRLTGHGEHVATDCPGRNLKGHLPGLRESLGRAR